MPADVLLEIDGLQTQFDTEGGLVRAVDGVSLEIHEGETLGLVGESGSGKSVTSLTVMRLLPDRSARITAGSVSFLGQDLVKLPDVEMRKIRGSEISMIFQEPGTSLNPVYRTGEQVMEAIRIHQKVSKSEARERAIKLYEEVGIPDAARRIDSYPHEMSGGQKQRVMIAMALSCDPKILIADEPTTALDVTIQAQILDLIRKLRDERGMSVLFITHDLGVIAEIADRVAVMFKGKLVEQGPIEQIFANPSHPYTKGLLNCRPRLESKLRRLPTVADYMDIRTLPDGELELTERIPSQERMRHLESAGRGPLLHSATELAATGYPSELSAYEPETAFAAMGAQPILRLTDLHVHYPIKKGIFRKTVGHVKAVDGVSFQVFPGQTLGLVGESGCGKTTTGNAIVKLTEITSGTIKFAGVDITSMDSQAEKIFRSDVQIIFQDPYSSLNPRMTIESALVEAMAIHGIGTHRRERRERAAALLGEVGLEPTHLRRYPHEFSGGQRQRISIARALAVDPKFIICDESVSALDVSVQAQVLNLLLDLQQERGLTYIFISHDLSVVRFMSDMMAVMSAGKIVEFGPSEQIYTDPKQEYTKQLISAIPDDSLTKIHERLAKRKQARAARSGT